MFSTEMERLPRFQAQVASQSRQTDIQTAATMGHIVAHILVAQCSALAEFHQPLCPPSDNPRRELFGHFHERWHFSVLPAGGSPLGARYSTHQPLFLDLAKHLKPSHSAEILCPHLPVNQAHKLFREAALSIFFGIPSY